MNREHNAVALNKALRIFFSECAKDHNEKYLSVFLQNHALAQNSRTFANLLEEPWAAGSTNYYFQHRQSMQFEMHRLLQSIIASEKAR